MKQRVECPYCDGQAGLKREPTELTFRKEKFTVAAHFYKCDKCREEFTTTETDAISLRQLHNQFREKHNIPFVEEISAIRQKYEISASKMSMVLGLGANGYSNYENGEIPVEGYGNLIRAAADPRTFLNLLDRAQEHFSEPVFKKTRDRVLKLVDIEDDFNDICKNLNVVNEPSNLTGYRKLDSEKIANLVTHLIQRSKPEFNDKLKINKQLFFADFTHYKNHGSSITGLSYRAIQYGPVPANYDNIYAWLESKQMIGANFLKMSNKGAHEVLMSDAIFDPAIFSKEELETIENIIGKFGNMATWDIVDLSHKEKAWKDLEAKRKLIGYQDYAFELAAL